MLSDEEKQTIDYLKARLYGNEGCKFIDVAQSDLRIFLKLVEMLDKQKDVTKKYENMIEAFECDFNLPFNYNDFTMFDDLKRLIQNKNKRLVKDIELLQELSFGIRYGNLKIIDKRNKLEGIIWN